MKHWIRDLEITFATATRGQGQINYVLFHFLRTAGWEWLWECDGYVAGNPNRVDDGNMEASGTGSYAALGGASLSKVTTPLRSGTQTLKVDSSAVNDGVETIALINMQDSEPYHVTVWASNNTGQAWNVDADNGSGYSNVGTIPHNAGVWTRYYFTFTTDIGGTRKLRFVDNLGSAGDLYISDILATKGRFEYSKVDDWKSGTDGSITSPDQFSSGSYTFVSGDIGKVVCVWDPTNFGNSGAYKITATAAGVATLNLRSGSASLTSETGLSWRMIDLAGAPDNPGGTDVGSRGAGFGLQSPHTSGHRLFLRQAQYGPASPYIDVAGIWAAPQDTDFDFSTGTFYKTGPSSQNDRQTSYTLPVSNTAPWTDMHAFVSGNEAAGTRRLFLMTDDDGSFLTMLSWDQSGGSSSAGDDCLVVGYLGADAQHPGVEGWGLFARWQYWYDTAWRTGLLFDDNVCRFARHGTVIGPDGITREALWAQYGIGTSNADIVSQSNAGPNRWSNKEWIHKPIIARDPDGVEYAPSERDADIGVYQGRQNMVDLTTFDSENYLHFRYGLVWEWSGVTVLP